MSLRTTINGIAVSRAFLRAFRAVLVTAAFLAALVGLARAQTNPPCALVDARVTVAPAYEPALLGTCRDTLTVTWDVGRQDPGHLDFLSGLSDGLCICDGRIVRFVGQAGTSTGVNGSGGACAVPFDGACDADESGNGTFVFDSPFSPGPNERLENAVAIKHGNSTCYGALVGQVPACDCSVPAGNQSWGQLEVFHC